MKTCNFLLLFYVFFINSATSYAGTAKAGTHTVKIENIYEKVKTFLQQEIQRQSPVEDYSNVKIHIRKINPNLTLPSCDKFLTVTLQGKKIQSNTSVKVTCPGSHPWSIYVNSTIKIEKRIIVSRYELPRQHIIEAKDLTTIERDLHTLRGGYSTTVENIVGKQVKRSIRSGNVIYNYQLQLPDIVKKGDKVHVVAKRGSLSVISSGIALSNAAKGEKIRVENQHSTRIIYAKVIGPGEVEVL